MNGKSMFYPQERTALFIDGANLYGAARNLEFDIDYKKLLQLFKDKTQLVRAYYYTVLIEDQEYSPIRPLVDWLDYNGYTLVTKPAKEFTDPSGRRRIRNSTNVEMAVDMLELADRIDHAVLFSGDGGFRRAIEAVQRRGPRVTVVSTVRTSPPLAADEIRRQADNFVDLIELKDEISRARTPHRDADEPDMDDTEDFDDYVGDPEHEPKGEAVVLRARNGNR
ncbi:MAG: NYN domain-containing protein [Alphaproteobacteria bacterium]|nr:NYN domain-containing protein [Alphaproteobacteria bacterium]